jgi:hypothetical protein
MGGFLRPVYDHPMRSFALLLVLVACGGGDSGDDSNMYVCSSCPDQPVSHATCEDQAMAAGCEGVTFELRTDQACTVSGVPREYSHCVFTNCSTAPTCFKL